MDFKKVLFYETTCYPIVYRSKYPINYETLLDLRLKILSLNFSIKDLELILLSPANYLYFQQNQDPIVIALMQLENPSVFEYFDNAFSEEILKSSDFGWVDSFGTIHTVIKKFRKIYQHKDIDPNTGYFCGKPTNTLMASRLNRRYWASFFSEFKSYRKFKIEVKKIGNRRRRNQSKNIIREQLKEIKCL